MSNQAGGSLGSPVGGVTVIKKPIESQIALARAGVLQPNEEQGHFRIDRAHLLYETKQWAPELPRERKMAERFLEWLRDHVGSDIVRAYYDAMLGHDIHLSLRGELYVKHYHVEERDPFTGELGWLENIGLVSRGKVTTAFRDFLAAQLVTDSTAIGDFKFHEVGTSATAEANTDTALVTTTGIARVAGTQTNPTASTYQSIATVTADTTETWQEHGIFNASTGVTLLDRSLISPTVSVVSLDTVQFTYVLTLNAEA